MKSPVWMTTPTGVSMASATQSTSECVTRIGSMVNGPMVKLPLRRDLDQLGIVQQFVLFELAFDIGQRELGGVDRNIELAQDPGQPADMVFVAVRQNDRRARAAVLDQIGDVGDDNVDAEKVALGEHEAGIDDDDVVFPADGQAVHAELAEAAKGDDLQFFALHL